MASSARIDELRKKFEENPRRYFAPLANEYRKAGDIDQAISICKEYLPQQPGHMSGHIVFGQALYEARQYEEARTVFETALALDPENLIALRHLGDIALIVGDIDGARGWYARVLEADPRNEEIQAQLKSLETVAPAAAPTPMSTPAIESSAPTAAVVNPVSSGPAAPASEASPLPTLELTAPAEPAQPTSTADSSAATVVRPVMPIPAIERTVEIPVTPPSAPFQSLSTAPTAEITLDQVPVPAVPDLEKAAEAPAADLPVEKTAGFEPTATGSAEEPPSVQSADLETNTPPPSDAPPIESFTLDGLETTSMSPAPAADAAPAAAPTAETPPAPLPDFEVTPPAETAAATGDGASESAQEPAATVVSEPSGVSEPQADAATHTADSPAASSELTFLDVGETSSPTAAASQPPPEPAREEPTAPVRDAAAEPPMAESKPFVTETMAELYEQQGHRDEALRVYRALLDQRPNDQHLLSRIERLEGKRGPTIRELLARAAARRPAPQLMTPVQPAEVLADASQPAAPAAEPAPPAVATESGTAPASEPEVPAAPPAAASAVAASAASPGARRDVLGQLFGGLSVADADENAAITLSAAFSTDGHVNGNGSATQQIPGAPAHPASKDLSLDAVFGSQSGPPPAASSFSFDQFFSERATAEHPAPAARGAEGQETRDDIAKFTQWLEGLKQR